ncbi:MAG: META domain-containing protein [Methanosarcinales archaeon]
MKKKPITGLIAIVAIVAVLIFAGCIDDKPPTPVSTPTASATPPTKTTFTPTPLPALTPTSTPTESSLEGRLWTLTNFIAESQGNVRSPISGTTITAHFEDGLISGTAGCNQYSGSYTTADKIVLNEMSWTEMLCMDPEGVMPQETQYLEILRDVTTFTIEENQLTLSTEDGRALVYHTKLANVKDIEIMLLESFPVQIKVVAKGEYPDSSTKVDEITTRREGNTFFVTLAASRPADVMCAQVITPFEEVIALDVVGLKAGVYTVDVNGVRDTFELQI